MRCCICDRDLDNNCIPCCKVNDLFYCMSHDPRPKRNYKTIPLSNNGTMKTLEGLTAGLLKQSLKDVPDNARIQISYDMDSCTAECCGDGPSNLQLRLSWEKKK